MEFSSEEFSSEIRPTRTSRIVASVGILLLVQSAILVFFVAMDIIEILAANRELSFWSSYRISALKQDAVFAAIVAIVFFSGGWAVLTRKRGARLFAGLLAALDLIVALSGLIFGAADRDALIPMASFIGVNAYMLLIVFLRRAVW